MNKPLFRQIFFNPFVIYIPRVKPLAFNIFRNAFIGKRSYIEPELIVNANF